MNLETLKVNVTTVVSIVVASFSLWFFMTDLIEEAVNEAKRYSIQLDIERDEGVVEMYRFQIMNGIAKSDAQGRIDALEAKIERRRQEKKDLM